MDAVAMGLCGGIVVLLWFLGVMLTEDGTEYSLPCSPQRNGPHSQSQAGHCLHTSISTV